MENCSGVSSWMSASIPSGVHLRISFRRFCENTPGFFSREYLRENHQEFLRKFLQKILWELFKSFSENFFRGIYSFRNSSVNKIRNSSGNSFESSTKISFRSSHRHTTPRIPPEVAPGISVWGHSGFFEKFLLKLLQWLKSNPYFSKVSQENSSENF